MSKGNGTGTRVDSPRLAQSSAVEWLPLSALRIDPTYQRRLEKAWVTARVSQFDPDAFDALTVSARPDGLYYVIDGQQRRALATDALGEDQRVPCNVFRGLSQDQEAALFLKLDDKRDIRTFDKFRARLTAKEPKVAKIHAIVLDAGLTIGETGAVGSISAVRALERVYDGCRIAGAKDGAGALRRTLRAIVEAWGREARNFEGRVLEGIGMVIVSYGVKVDETRLISILKKITGGAAGLKSTAVALARAHSCAHTRGVGGAVIEEYNKGLGVNRKLKGWWA